MRTKLILFVISISMICDCVTNRSYFKPKRDRREIVRKVPLSVYKSEFKVSLPSITHEIEDSFLGKNLTTKIKIIKREREEDVNPLVSTAEGLVRGTTVRENGMKYYSFLGMRYAEKPARFQAPKPLKSWTGVKDHVSEGKYCLQRDEISHIIGGSEDCLHISVHTPTLDDKKIPVILWIHGNKFRSGTGNSDFYNPERFLKRGIVFVAIDYRLGPFGFLSTGTSHAPGNAGMKDILEALRWMKRNIHMFGGDTYNICLYGVSSGAALVEYVTLSPLANELYSKAIIHSGSALSYWAFSKNPVEYTYKLGERLKINTTDLDTLMNGLNTWNASEIIKATIDIDHNGIPEDRFDSFRPCIEKSLLGKEAFLTDHPYNIIKSGNYNHVPIMLGMNDMEGISNLRSVLNITSYIKTADKIMEFLIPSDLMEVITSPKVKKDVINKVTSFYFKNKTLGPETVSGLINFLGDTQYYYGIHKTAKYRMKNNKYPIYYYQFAYDGNLYDYSNVRNLNISGVAHADDLAYTFALPLGKEKFYSSDLTQKVSDRLVTLMANFVKYSNPTPLQTDLLPIKWNPITSTLNYEYLEITDTLKMKKNPNKERNNFWSEIYFNVTNK